MDRRPTWTDCDEAGDYVVPNVLSPRDLVFRPDYMDETVPHTSGPRVDGSCLGQRKMNSSAKFSPAAAFYRQVPFTYQSSPFGGLKSPLIARYSFTAERTVRVFKSQPE